MKIISWNVNGIRAAWSHGLSSFIDSSGADIYAFQETKTTEAIPLAEVEGYSPYWSFCDKRNGYSGTLVLTKQEPINVRYDIGNDDFDTEGRIITLEYENFYLVNCYVPNSQRSKWRYDYRTEWDGLMLSYLVDLQHRKPVIACGDFNASISDKDIYEQSKWIELNAEGFQATERENLLLLTQNGYVDSYRLMHPDETGKYTWWSNRLNKRRQNYGWRLDYFFVSKKLCSLVQESTMLTDVLGSDHCPIVLEINLSEHKAESNDRPKRQTTYTYTELINMEKRGIRYDYIKYADMTDLWNSVDWDAAENHLRNMQTALAKSAYTKNWGLIKKWQKKIVYSLDAKLLAVRHVCSTAGGSGVDCVRWSTPHEKMSAALSLTSKGYRAMPSRLIIINGRNGKQRRIHVETYYDRAMETLYAYSLDPVAESWGDRKSFAYRKGRSSFDMNEYVKNAFSGEDAPEWILRVDVQQCYENISHDWILRRIPLAPNVLREFLNAGYVFAGELFPMNVGIGIGCSISPIIANMALDGLQKYIFDHLYPNGGKIDYANGNMIRYADDIIVAARDENTARQIKGYIKKFLTERGLKMSLDKTEIININDGFTFMSRTYKKQGNQLYAYPSYDAISRFMDSMRETIENYTGSQKSLIEKINKKIDGWTTYHKVTEAEEAFQKMDVYISALLLELCEKKHPKWDRERILEKYWYVDAEGRHHYALPNKKEISVKFLADTLCVNYFPVKTNVNPYIDLEYVEKRSNERQILNVTGVYRSIWNRQGGRCYYCGKRILRDEKKMLTEICNKDNRKSSRFVYVHSRCMDGTVEYIDTDTAPSSLDDVMKLLERLEDKKKTQSQKFCALSEFFRTCAQNSVTLTFKQIETIMGSPLGATAQRKEFWYRTGFLNISQCWLDNGYEIKALHLDGRQRVVFHLTDESRNTASIELPPVLKYQRVPVEAKYELENYCQYIIKKYGL